MTPSLMQLLLRVAGLSLIAFGGGNVLLPAVHHVVVGGGWIDDAAFARAVSTAQIAPGPNMMYISLMGYEVAGIPGALCMLSAFLAPTLLIAVLVSRYIDRTREHRLVVAMRRAVRPVAGGILTAAGIALAARFSAHSYVDVGVTVAVAALVMTTRVGALPCIAAAALLGALLR